MSYSAVRQERHLDAHRRVGGQGHQLDLCRQPQRCERHQVTVPRRATRCAAEAARGADPGGVVPGYDADDPDTTRTWKLFTHAYVVIDGRRARRDLGYIALFTAPDPTGPWKDEGKTMGWKAESRTSLRQGRRALCRRASPAWQDCAGCTEPGALWRNGGILDLAAGLREASRTRRDPHRARALVRSRQDVQLRGRLLDGRRTGSASAAACRSSTHRICSAPRQDVPARRHPRVHCHPPAATGYRGCLAVRGRDGRSGGQA